MGLNSPAFHVLFSLQYQWSTDGPTTADLNSRNSRTLRLERGSLQGGHKYKFTCRVTNEDDSSQRAVASVVVPVASRGLEARMNARELTFGSDNTILLDGSLCIDLDHRPGALAVDLRSTM